MIYAHRFSSMLLPLTISFNSWGQTTVSKPDAAAIPYLRLSVPRRVLTDAQPWEGNQFPHTLSVLELRRGASATGAGMDSMRGAGSGSLAVTTS